MIREKRSNDRSNGLLSILFKNKLRFLRFILSVILCGGVGIGICWLFSGRDRWIPYNTFYFGEADAYIAFSLIIFISLCILTIAFYFIFRRSNKENKMVGPIKYISRFLIILAALPVNIITLILIIFAISNYSTYRLNRDIDNKYSKDHLSSCEVFINKLYNEHSNYIYFDYTNELEIIKEVGEMDNAKAQNMLGLHYGYIDSRERAMYWFKRSADNGDKYGQFNLGICYLGIHLPERRDIEKALHYFTLSANNGFGLAFYKLGQIYTEMELYEKARGCFAEGAKLKDENCKAMLENIDYLN